MCFSASTSQIIRLYIFILFFNKNLISSYDLAAITKKTVFYTDAFVDLEYSSVLTRA